MHNIRKLGKTNTQHIIKVSNIIQKYKKLYKAKISRIASRKSIMLKLLPDD